MVWIAVKDHGMFMIYRMIYEIRQKVLQPNDFFLLKFKYSEKATKFEKIFHLEFDTTWKRQILSGRFFQTLWPSQTI